MVLNEIKAGNDNMGRFRKLSLTKQILFLVLMMLIILLISFVISNKIAERIVERKVTDSVDKILLQVEEKMNSFYGDMEGISTSLLYSPTIQSLLNARDVLSVVLMNDEVTSMFANTMSLKENIRGIRLNNSEGTMVANIGAGIGDSVQTSGPKDRIFRPIVNERFLIIPSPFRSIS